MEGKESLTVDSPPPTYEDIFISDTEPTGPEAVGGGGTDNWSDDELSTTHPFSGANLFSAEPDTEAPGGLIFPDLPNVGGGVDEVTDLFGAQSVADNVRGTTSASSASSSTGDSAPVSVVDPLPGMVDRCGWGLEVS